jgi:hypothetical protein
MQRDYQDVPRLNTRLAVEMISDSFEIYEEPKALLKHLSRKGFYPELLRSKGYLNLPHVVAVVPAYSTNLKQLAAVSVRRNLDDVSNQSVSAAGTIVTVDTVMTPINFTILRVVKGKVVENGPISFRAVEEKGFQRILKELNLEDGPVVFSKLTRGRALAPVVLDDLVEDELRAGYLTRAEAGRVLSNAELSADIARLHAYISEATGAVGGGCSACCSSSCFGCTSCSCFIITPKPKPKDPAEPGTPDDIGL